MGSRFKKIEIIKCCTACHSRAGGNPVDIEITLRKMKSYFVYILASQKNGTLYIGVTSDLARRTWEHKEGFTEDFTKRYKIKQLVYYEQTENVLSAITREKQLKKWNRAWKIRLIEKDNPKWKDLSNEL
jgi:putative endonuclease